MAEQRSFRYMVFLVLFMGLVGQMDVWLSTIETTAVPELVNWFGITIIDWGFWSGVFGLIVFFVFLIGWFSDAFGRKKGILLLMLVMGIPTIFIGLFPFNFFVFLLLYSIVIMGTTSNLWEVPITEEATAAKRGTYGGLAFLVSVLPLSSIIGVDIIFTYGWQWGYGVMFVLMLILLVFLYFIKEPQRWVDAEAKREKRLGFIEAVKALGRKDLTYIFVSTIVYLMWTIAFKLGIAYGGYFYLDVLLVSQSQWRLIQAIGGIMLPISALISGVLLDRIGRNITLVIGTIGSVIAFIGLGLTTMPAFYWGVYFFMAMVLAWVYVYLAEIFPTPVRSTSIGICVAGSRLGYMIGPLLSVVLLSIFPTMGGFWIITGLLMIIPLFALAVRPYETKGETLEDIEDKR